MQLRYHSYDGKDCWHFKFAKGEGLELHEHSFENFHDTLVLEGECKISGPDNSWSMILGKGDFYAFSDSEMHHQIDVISDYAEVLNIYRLPMPNIQRAKDQGWIEQ